MLNNVEITMGVMSKGKPQDPERMIIFLTDLCRKMLKNHSYIQAFISATQQLLGFSFYIWILKLQWM